MNQFVLYSNCGECLDYIACITLDESRKYFKQKFPELEQAVIINSSTNRCSDL